MTLSKFHSAAHNSSTNGNLAFTDKGDVSNASTLNSHLELFGRAANINTSEESTKSTFRLALQENEDLSIRLALYLRDIRGGKGRREVFYDLLDVMYDVYGIYDNNILDKVLLSIPEFGYFKDYLNIRNDHLREYAIRKYFVPALLSGNKLASKYAPRATGRRKNADGKYVSKGKYSKYSSIFMHELRMIDKVVPLHKIDKSVLSAYNKLLSSSSETVEQLITRKAWKDIKFNHVPSRAMMRHSTSFRNNANEHYQKYLDKLVSGEETINAGTLYPHDIVAASGICKYSCSSNNGVDHRQLNAQFNKMLKDIKIDAKLLPVIDTSGSMLDLTGLKSGGNEVTCLDVSIGLGTFIAKANKGEFKDLVLTFSSDPAFVDISKEETPISAFKLVKGINWGMSTNIDSTIDLILSHAIENEISPTDMPEYLVILSDMQFNENLDTTINQGYTKSFYNRYKEKFQSGGYTIPKVVFWNLNMNSKSAVPVSKFDTNVSLVSGYDTNMMKSLFNGELNPLTTMLNELNVERYNILNR